MPKFKQSMYVILTVVLVCFAASQAQSQNSRTKTFPLDKEFSAQVALCSTLEYAKEATDDDTAVTFQVYVLLGHCGAGLADVTYKKLVYSVNGSNVYEVQIGGQKLWALTDWRHDSL